MAFEAGVPYILHLTDLTQWDDGGGTILAEGPWDFEIVFDHLNDGQLELISQPATVSANGASLTLTSFKLGTMGAEVTPASGWGTGVRVPAYSFSRASTMAWPPIRARRSWRLP